MKRVHFSRTVRHSLVLLVLSLAFGLGAGYALVPVACGQECGREVLNGDGQWDDVFQLPGLVDYPDFGSVAECYRGSAEVCGITLYLTWFGQYVDMRADLYVWDDGGGEPGEVLRLQTNVRIGTPPFYPAYRRYALPLNDPCCTGESWWVGFWSFQMGDGIDALEGSLDGPSGCPYVKLAPDSGYPPGWQPASVVWGPVQALGIGALVNECPPVPTKTTTWGAVKGLYR